MQHGRLKAPADPVRLRMFDLGARVLDVVDRDVEVGGMAIVRPQVSVPRSVTMRQSGISCSSKSGSTRSLSRSAAVLGVFSVERFAAATLEYVSMKVCWQ